jgi:hypothetical protein
VKIKKLDPRAIQPKTTEADKAVSTTTEPMRLRIKTAVRAGDVYMQNPRGSNNRFP